jgi:hypothetical protein
MDALAAEPDELGKWVTRMWRHWYAALRAEATVLAGHPDASGRLAAARTVVAGNPVAGAIIDRAEALLGGHRNRLLATVAAFDSAGSRYQWARTLRFAGGDEAATGAAALADLGVAPMRRDRLIKRRASPGACPLPRQPAGRRPARSTGGELGDRPLDLRWALGRRSAACWLDNASDLSCMEDTGQYPWTIRGCLVNSRLGFESSLRHRSRPADSPAGRSRPAPRAAIRRRLDAPSRSLHAAVTLEAGPMSPLPAARGRAARSGCARTPPRRRCRCTPAPGSCRSRARRPVV